MNKAMLAHHSMVSWPGYVCTATNSVSTTGNQAPSQATNHKPAAGAASDAPSRHPHPTTRVQATANTAPRILPLFAASRHDKHDYIHRALTKTSMFFCYIIVLALLPLPPQQRVLICPKAAAHYKEQQTRQQVRACSAGKLSNHSYKCNAHKHLDCLFDMCHAGTQGKTP